MIKRFLVGGLFQNMINVPWWSSLSIHIMQGCSPLLKAAPQVEAPACPTQGKNQKTLYIWVLYMIPKQVTNFGTPQVYL